MKKETVEKPILFKPEMVEALLENRKTVTRRLVLPQPPDFVDFLEYKAYNKSFQGYMQAVFAEPTVHFTKAKYWPGLLLWVREPFLRMICPPNSILLKDDNDGWYVHGDSLYFYKAGSKYYPDDKWHSPIFLPRIASRFLLKITDVKIERLHELDDIDAVLEGCKNRENYARLWNEINGKTGYTWDKNPWVYRIEFENKGADYGGN
ncbi:hypothetical protein [Treponema sp. R80B11-R83G3]